MNEWFLLVLLDISHMLFLCLYLILNLAVAFRASCQYWRVRNLMSSFRPVGVIV